MGRFWSLGVYDHGNIEPIEYIFHYYFKSRQTNALIDSKITNLTGSFYMDVALNLPVLLRKPDAQGYVEWDVIDDDGDWPDDEYISGHPLTSETHNDGSSISIPHWSGGEWRCGWQFDYQYPRYDCDPLFWKEVNLNHKWSPSTYIRGGDNNQIGDYVTISGSDEAEASASCVYMVGSNFTADVYEWYLNGNYIGTGTSKSFTAPASDFDLAVGAYSSDGHWAWDTKYVSIVEFAGCEAMAKRKRPPGELTPKRTGR